MGSPGREVLPRVDRVSLEPIRGSGAVKRALGTGRGDLNATCPACLTGWL